MEPAVSVIIPAFNEEVLVARTVASVHRALGRMHRPFEVIVVDNNSSDATAAAALKAGARVVFEPVNQISRARNTGARSARGHYLLFVDADTIVRTGLMAAVLRLLDSGTCCGGGSTLRFNRPPGLWVEPIVALWNALSPVVRLSAGCFLFCRRDAFNAIGGFSEGMFAAEEFWFCWQLRMEGWRTGRRVHVVSSSPVITSARKFQWHSMLSLIASVGMLGLLPLAVREKRLCGLWYRRPHGPPSAAYLVAGHSRRW